MLKIDLRPPVHVLARRKESSKRHFPCTIHARQKQDRTLWNASTSAGPDFSKCPGLGVVTGISSFERRPRISAHAC